MGCYGPGYDSTKSAWHRICDRTQLAVLVERSCIAKYEVYGSLNETFLEVVSPIIVVKGILCTIESASIEGSLVP